MTSIKNCSFDVQQYNRLVADDPNILQAADAAILVTHQPPEWLLPENKAKTFEPMITRSGRFAAHLCGHMHVAKSETVSRGSSAARRLYLGRSLLAVEPTRDGLDHVLGYQALRIEIDPDKQRGLCAAGRARLGSRNPTIGSLCAMTCSANWTRTTVRPGARKARPTARAGRTARNRTAPQNRSRRRKLPRHHEPRCVRVRLQALPARAAPPPPSVAEAARPAEDLGEKARLPPTTKSPWHRAVVDELASRLDVPSTHARWAANLDTAILEHDGKFTGRYRTRSIKIFQVVRPTHFLQFDFQFGRAGSFDGTNLQCSVLDKNLDPLKFDFHVQETTKAGDDPLRSFRVFFLFDQVLTPDSVDQPYRAEYQFEGDDPYPNLGVGLEASTITMRQGGADQAILCVAFPRAKEKRRLQILDMCGRPPSN